MFDIYMRLVLELQAEKVLPLSLVSPFDNLVCFTALSVGRGGYFFALDLPKANPRLKAVRHRLTMLINVSVLIGIVLLTCKFRHSRFKVLSYTKRTNRRQMTAPLQIYKKTICVSMKNIRKWCVNGLQNTKIII